MGIFSKSPKSNPKIRFEGIEAEFHRENEWWEFTYREVNFSTFDVELNVPSKGELDWILSMLETLMPELRARVKNGLSEWSDAKLDDGETFSVDVKDFARERAFNVSWSGGASWGDLGVDFTIKGNAIVDESWGD